MAASSPQLNRINHIVTLMMENRSFDNVLGWLYDPANKPPFDKPPRGQTFEGVSGKDLWNPTPTGGKAFVGKGTVMTDPYPDPFEPYDEVYAQMYNQNPPPAEIPNPTTSPEMKGFVDNYANAIKAAGAPKKGCNRLLSWLFRGDSPMDFDPGIIMNCFTPGSLPVINGLANAYAVCDKWFSSVPTQTFPNRSFVHAATSSGYVTNGWKTGPDPWDIGYLLNKTTTIYNALSEANFDWRIYHGGPLLLCNALVTQERLWEYLPLDHFFPFKQFLDDAKKPGGLPPYTFIEPNMLCSRKYGPENDMHPAFAITATGAATNALYGDQLIHTIYEALRNSPDWESTLFIITFDEHGGTYDHVPTPLPWTCSPDGIVIPYGQPGDSGFLFNRFGVRVPAVVVSPLIEPGTICHTQFDHTSIIRTVAKRWLGEEHLTERDKAAHDLSELLTLPSPRKDIPDIKPNSPPSFTGCGSHPLSPLHSDMLGAAAQFLAACSGRTIKLDALKTTDEAVTELDAHEAAVRAHLS
jgi:phospholipase C